MELNAIAEQVRRELERVAPDKEVRMLLAEGGVYARGSTGEELSAAIADLVVKSEAKSATISTGFCSRGEGTGAIELSAITITIGFAPFMSTERLLEVLEDLTESDALRFLVEGVGGRLSSSLTEAGRIRFVIRIPYCAREKHQASFGFGGGKTVLVVEDEDLLRKITAEVLKNEGYRVLEAPDGESAMKLFGQVGGKVDLLMTDLVMPGMSGLDLAVELVSRSPDLQTLVVSGFTADFVPRKVSGAPVNQLLKPYSLDDLLRKVREVLHGCYIPATAARDPSRARL